MSGPRALLVAALVALAAALGGGAVFFAAMPVQPGSADARTRPVWSETNWPFPIDQWGGGRAFNCTSADCRSAVTLYLRAKAGFCNCTTGVADDEELDRVADLNLAGGQSAALGAGRPVIVHRMNGRSRGYALRNGSAKSALAIAFNDRCDVVVATAVIENGQPDSEAAVLQFLNGDLVLRWIETALGL